MEIEMRRMGEEKMNAGAMAVASVGWARWKRAQEMAGCLLLVVVERVSHLVSIRGLECYKVRLVRRQVSTCRAPGAR